MDSQCYVFTGGPSSGKSWVLSELMKRGHHVFPEAAREVLNARAAYNPPSREEWLVRETMIYERQKQLESLALTKSGPCFFDRGFGDFFAYLHYFVPKSPSFPSPHPLGQYEKVFLFERYPLKQDGTRVEMDDVQAALMEQLAAQEYERMGHSLIHVPRMDVSKRADYVLSHLE